MQPEELRTWQVDHSPSLDRACDRFLDDLGAWAHACVDRYADAPPTDVHDQLTYTTGWEPYLRICRDERMLAFLDDAQRRVAAHFHGTDQWRHGYWRMQEAHHGTEHFELFLSFMARVYPGETTTAQLVDAVEHLGNWSDDVPAWYDPETGLYRSLFFGADGVREDPAQLNMPDHLRCANLLLLAYDVTAAAEYLDLARSYAARWATAIRPAGTPLPAGINRDGILYGLSNANDETYHSFAGMAGLLDSDLDRAENILASGGIQLFLRLWQETGDPLFLDAVERLLDILKTGLTDPDAGVVADIIRAYRRATGRTRYDADVLSAAHRARSATTQTLAVDLSVKRTKRPEGVGKRADMPIWYEDGQPRAHSPILLAAAAEIDDDPGMATAAVDLARTYLALATEHMPDGRHHGCAAASVSAVARGHGRDNNAGMATAVLLPVMEHFGQ